jgi:hypothetical protein
MSENIQKEFLVDVQIKYKDALNAIGEYTPCYAGFVILRHGV